MKKEGKMITDNTKTLYNALEKIDKLQSENTKLREILDKLIIAQDSDTAEEGLDLLIEIMDAYEAFKEGNKP